MSRNSTAASIGGTGLFCVLGIVFVVLKLTHVIDWSWWWVMAPFWAPVLLILEILAFVGVVFLIGHLRGR